MLHWPRRCMYPAPALPTWLQRPDAHSAAAGQEGGQAARAKSNLTLTYLSRNLELHLRPLCN